MLRERLETALLFLTLLAVAAFVGSFVAGLDWSRPGSTPGSTAAPAVTRPPARAPHPADRPAGEVVPANLAQRRRVEVLNGAGKPGLARDATQLLREAGYDVVFFGNAGSFAHVESVVIDRVGSPASARAVADVLGIGQVRGEPDPELYLDVTVILGDDWAPPARSEVAEPESVGERALRLLRSLDGAG